MDQQPIWEGLLGEDEHGPYLVGGACGRCGFVTLGRRDLCPSCWARNSMEARPIGRRGVLYTYTVVHQAPEGFPAPYVLGYVDVEDQVRVLAHLERRGDCPRVGDELVLTVAPLRREAAGVTLTGPRYRPLAEEET